MTFDPSLHHRRSIRLKEYDYNAAGAYFITTCVRDRKEILGTIEDFEINLNVFGQIVHKTWETIPVQYRGVELDAFVVMPNHVHGILIFPHDANSEGVRSRLSRVVGWFKQRSAGEIMRQKGWLHFTLWQRNYYEHIVRSEAELERIRTYIEENPGRWGEDELNTTASRHPILLHVGPRPY